MPDVTYFVDDVAKTAREAEVVAASFSDGGNHAGSNACGLGINQGGGPVVGTPPQFTLLDQHGNAREAQISQSIGGHPYVAAASYPSSGGEEGTAPDAVVRFGTTTTNGDGVVTSVGNSTLSDISVGWTINV